MLNYFAEGLALTELAQVVEPMTLKLNFLLDFEDHK